MLAHGLNVIHFIQGFFYGHSQKPELCFFENKSELKFKQNQKMLLAVLHREAFRVAVAG